MPVYVKSRRASAATRAGWRGHLRVQHGTVELLDLTSRGPQPWVQFSPFYPHAGIPVPFMSDATSQSVEGIWQALKVFEHEGVDAAKLAITSMTGLKRAARTRGRVLGHQAGLHGTQLLSYGEARRTIYLPSYRWVLDHRLQDLVQHIQRLAAGGAIVLLDYETNSDVDNLSKPLSRAGLVAAYLEDRWPT